MRRVKPRSFFIFPSPIMDSLPNDVVRVIVRDAMGYWYRRVWDDHRAGFAAALHDIEHLKPRSRLGKIVAERMGHDYALSLFDDSFDASVAAGEAFGVDLTRCADYFCPFVQEEYRTWEESKESLQEYVEGLIIDAYVDAAEHE